MATMASLLVPIAEKEDEDSSSLSSSDENNLVETLSGNPLEELERKLWEQLQLHSNSVNVGRLSLLEAAQILGIAKKDLVDRLLPEIIREDPSLLLIVEDEVLTKDCLDQLTAQAITQLEQSEGRLLLSSIAERVYRLPEGAVFTVLSERMSMLPNVHLLQLDSTCSYNDEMKESPKVLVTKEYLDSYHERVKEVFLSLTEPAHVATIAKERGWDLAWVTQILESMTMSPQNELWPGKLSGEIYVPPGPKSCESHKDNGPTTTSSKAGDNFDDGSTSSYSENHSHGHQDATSPLPTPTTMAESDKLVLLRGPSLVMAVLILSVLPYLRYLSILSIARALIMLVGFALFAHDVKLVLLDQLRSFAHRALDNFVLDDFLKAIFDPETGLIAACIGTCVGNSAMYSLPLTVEQRVELVQSALYLTDRQQAATVLRESGGCKTLLPDAAQAWLQQDTSNLSIRSAPEVCLDLLPPSARDWVHDLILPRSKLAASVLQEPTKALSNSAAGALTSPSETTVRTTLTADDGEGSTTSSELFDRKVERQLFADVSLPATVPRIVEKEEPGTAVSSNAERNKKEGSRPLEAHSLAAPPPLPHEVMGSIVQDMVMQRIKHFVSSIPTGSLEKTGLVAAAFLFIQFRYSRRARQMLWGVLQGSTTLCLSSVVAGCVAAVTAKHCYGDRPSDQQDTLFESSPLHILSTIQQLLRRAGVTGRKWKEVLAVLIISYFGRKQQQQV
jgi:hypothetical protein